MIYYLKILVNQYQKLVENIQQLESLKIFDLSGKQVQFQKLDKGNNRINISLHSGVYFVQFNNGKQTITEKLIVK